MDVDTLKHSIDKVKAPRIVAEEIVGSKICFEEVKNRRVLIYLTTTMSKTGKNREGSTIISLGGIQTLAELFLVRKQNVLFYNFAQLSLLF